MGLYRKRAKKNTEPDLYNIQHHMWQVSSMS